MATSWIARARSLSEAKEVQYAACRVRTARHALKQRLKIFGVEVGPEEITVPGNGDSAAYFAGAGVVLRYFTGSARFVLEYCTMNGIGPYKAEVPNKFPGGVDDALVWLGGNLRRWDEEAQQ